jgi:putative transposase
MVVSLTDLTEQERVRAMERFEILRPFLEEDVELFQIAHEHQVSLRTLRRWVQRYHNEGLVGLSRR